MVAFAPSGKAFATGGTDGVILLWDAAAGKPMRKLAAHKEWVVALAFSPDGKRIASGGNDNAVRIWDAGSGDVLAEFKGHEKDVRWVDFSADGGTVISGAADGTIRVWDVKARKESRRLGGIDGNCPPVLSADRRLLAYAAGLADEKQHELHVWNVAEWREVRRILAPGGAVRNLAFSPDGAILAEFGNGSEAADDSEAGIFYTVALWEVGTGSLIGRLNEKNLKPILSGLSFSPDGRRLALCHTTKALVWDVSRWPAPAKTPTDPPPIPRLWGDLASSDATQAHRASWAGVASPKEALKELKGRLRPVAAAQVTAIPGLVRQLDSDDFDERQQASRELEKIGSCAESALRRAAKESPSAEVRRRAEDLLTKLDANETRLREVRAIPLLERIGTADAKKLLEELAKGAPDATLTREAKAALERLARRGGS